MNAYKKQILTLVMVLFAIVLGTNAQEPKVLFIGNSYTEYNNLPEVLKMLANSNGDSLKYVSNTPGGCTFQQHLFNQSASYIRQGDWDYVVLQEQSQIPSFPDNDFYNICYPYAQQLCQMINQYCSDAQTVFYMTWGRKYGDQQNCQIFPPLCTYEGMDSLLYLRYMIMAEDNDAWVSPVGALWHYIRDNHPDIDLYGSDGSHPSAAGTYAAACSFYALIYGKTPLNSPYTFSLSDQVAKTIQKAAETVVYDSLSKWRFGGGETSIIRQTEENDIHIKPNPAGDAVTVISDESISEINIYSVDGRLVDKRKVDGLSEVQLNVSMLKAGCYMMQVIGKQQYNKIIKFIKR